MIKRLIIIALFGCISNSVYSQGPVAKLMVERGISLIQDGDSLFSIDRAAALEKYYEAIEAFDEAEGHGAAKLFNLNNQLLELARELYENGVSNFDSERAKALKGIEEAHEILIKIDPVGSEFQSKVNAGRKTLYNKIREENGQLREQKKSLKENVDSTGLELKILNDKVSHYDSKVSEAEKVKENALMKANKNELQALECEMNLDESQRNLESSDLGIQLFIGQLDQFLDEHGSYANYMVWLRESGEIYNLTGVINVLIRRSVLFRENKEKYLENLDSFSADELIQILNALIPEARQMKSIGQEDPRIVNFFFGNFESYKLADSLLSVETKVSQKAALGIFKELNESYPDNALIKLGLAVNYEVLGDPNASELNYEQAGGNNPETLARYEEVLNRIPESHIRLFALKRTVELNNEYENLSTYGKLLLEKKKWDQGMEVFIQLEQINPNDPDVLDNLGHCYYRLSSKADGEERMNFANKALNYFQRSLELYPYSSWTYRMISHCYFKLKDYESAYDTSQDAINNGYNAYFSLSWYCLFVDKPEEAIEAATEYLKIDPTRITIESNRVLGYLLSEQLDKAEEIYKEWKDKEWPDDRYATFKESFLADISDLEKAGISGNFELARQWLNE